MTQNKVIVIAAVGIDGEIGIGNNLPWKLSSDLKNFKMLTTNNIIIMGRKTFDSIGKPLPNRINIVITSDREISRTNTDNLYFVNSIDEALLKCEKVDYERTKKIFIIGGGKIYEQFLNENYVDIVDECCITHVYNTDQEMSDETVYFPEINSSIWKQSSETEIFSANDKDEYDWKIATYSKR